MEGEKCSKSGVYGEPKVTFDTIPIKASAGGQASISVAPSPIITTEV